MHALSLLQSANAMQDWLESNYSWMTKVKTNEASHDTHYLGGGGGDRVGRETYLWCQLTKM